MFVSQSGLKQVTKNRVWKVPVKFGGHLTHSLLFKKLHMATDGTIKTHIFWKSSPLWSFWPQAWLPHSTARVTMSSQTLVIYFNLFPKYTISSTSNLKTQKMNVLMIHLFRPLCIPEVVLNVSDTRTKRKRFLQGCLDKKWTQDKFSRASVWYGKEFEWKWKQKRFFFIFVFYWKNSVLNRGGSSRQKCRSDRIRILDFPPGSDTDRWIWIRKISDFRFEIIRKLSDFRSEIIRLPIRNYPTSDPKFSDFRARKSNLWLCPRTHLLRGEIYFFAKLKSFSFKSQRH